VLLLSNGRLQENGRDDLFFIHQMVPKPCLYVFGAGEDAKPLVSLAAGTGLLLSNGRLQENGRDDIKRGASQSPSHESQCQLPKLLSL
jgi:hypothetical protein